MAHTGYKTRAVFERYNIVSEGDLSQAAAKLDRVMGTFLGTLGEENTDRATLKQS